MALVESSLPVVGTVETASIGFVAIALLLVTAYILIGRLPLTKQSQLTPRSSVFYAKLVSSFILLALIAGSWDVWWHRAIGRDDFFIPPHIMLYSFAGLAIITGLFAWYRTHERVWRKMALALFLIPLSAPFDNLWHIIFGVEDFSRPVSLSWSPPHMLLDLAAMAALIFCLKILLKDRNENERSFFVDLIFAAIFGMSIFLVMPFHPTEGWGQVAGFWGAGALAFVYVGLMSATQKVLKNPYDVLRVVSYFIFFTLISYGKETAPGIIILPHDRQPIWLLVFSFVFSAITMEAFVKKVPAVIRGTLAGTVWAGILFLVSPYFFSVEFTYPISEGVKAVVSGALGGLVGSLLVSAFFRSRKI